VLQCDRPQDADSRRDGEPIESCTIVTTEANAVVKPFHDRMPVVLAGHDLAAWLDTKADPGKLFVPSPAKEWGCRPVNPLVNSPKNDRPECLETPLDGDKAAPPPDRPAPRKGRCKGQ
jgi:putative SOS response-associated peptidase YedK